MTKNASNSTYHCSICENQFVDEDYLLRQPQDFISVCKNHRDCAQSPQVWLVKKRLGFKYEIPELKCAFCPTVLSDKEVESILETHIHITCDKHRAGANVCIANHYITPEQTEEYVSTYNNSKLFHVSLMDYYVVEMLALIASKSFANSTKSFASMNDLLKVCKNTFTADQIIKIFYGDNTKFHMCGRIYDLTISDDLNDQIGLVFNNIKAQEIKSVNN